MGAEANAMERPTELARVIDEFLEEEGL